jgi:hypothetical protein
MRAATEPEGSKSFSSLYRCAVPTQCLSIAGSKDSPVCAILASRDHLVVKLHKIGKERYMSRGDYEAYCEDHSVKEIMEDELDVIIWRLMEQDESAADGQDKGRGESLSWAIALVDNPYAPNMDIVKNKAMLRYERKLREATESLETDGD